MPKYEVFFEIKNLQREETEAEDIETAETWAVERMQSICLEPGRKISIVAIQPKA